MGLAYVYWWWRQDILWGKGGSDWDFFRRGQGRRGRLLCGWPGWHFVQREEQLWGKGGGGKNICVLGYFCIGILCWELGGAGEIFEEGMKAPVRTREDGRKLAFTTIFDGIMDGAGGGGRRYCGESVGAMVCIFGVGSRVCVVAVGRIDTSD